MLPAPRDAPAPLLALCESIMVTPGELAKHWRMSPDYLGNLRVRGRGIPHVKLPTGKVLYRLSDILAAELAGTAGDLTLARVELALAAMPSRKLAPETRHEITEHLRSFFGR